MLALIQKSFESARQHALLDKLLDRRHQHHGPRRRAGRIHPPQRRKILFESLEPRLLLSADLLPGSVQAPQDGAALPIQVQLTPSAISAPQIRWMAPVSTGDTALFANSMVSAFDLDNFNSPLAPVAPAGGLVHAGGVQGTLEFEGDSDTMSITLEGAQTFSLRLSAPAALQARLQAFDPDGNALGVLEAANAGDSLVLQVRAAATSGAYSVQVDSLAGTGSYTVELFLNAALEDPDSTDAASAQDLDGVFSALLDSPATRAAVVGSMSAPLGNRVIAQENFEDGSAFGMHLLDGTWSLSSSNPDAPINRVQYGEGGNALLEISSDQTYVYDVVQVDNGEGGTYSQDRYTYDAALGTATWRVDLRGLTVAVLEFDHAGYDPRGDSAAESEFQNSADFDGVALSVDGENWIVLQEFGAVYNGGTLHALIDLVSVAASYGLTLGPDTLIRFQHYDAGGSFDNDQNTYRSFDNIRITTDQQQFLLTPVDSFASGAQDSDFFNPLDLLTDGRVPREGSSFEGSGSVWWLNQEAAPIDVGTSELSTASGALSGMVFGLDLGAIVHVSGLLLSLDNNDDYAVDYSLDGLSWMRLADILAGAGDVSGGMDTFRLGSAGGAVNADLPLSPTAARYLRFYATAGDGMYGVGDIQVFSETSADQEDWYRLTLEEGELVSFTLSLETPADNGTMELALYDADMNLVTIGQPASGPVAQSIENFRAPASGIYTVRVLGNTLGDYNLVAVRQAQFGAAAQGTQDLTLTPVVLDALAGGSGSTVRVAVLNGGGIINQLADDTHFDFSVTNVSYDQIDTLQELSSFDAVVLGAYVDPYYVNNMASTLRTWVEAGNGLVTTGWMQYYLSLQYSSPHPDLDAIIPVNQNNYASYAYNSTPVIITDSSHPVTQGITDFSSNYYYDYLVFGTAGIDAGATTLGTVGAYPGVVVGQVLGGRSVALAPDYADGSNWSTGMPDQLLEQAVAWAAPPTNWYKVQALAGTDLQISLDLLHAGTGEPQQDLQPTLEILDAAGTTVLASGSLSASVPVSEDSLFTVRVRGVGAGDYLLRAQGDLPDVAYPLTVTSSSLDDAGTLLNFPGAVDIHFSEPVLLTSVDPADLLVNGTPATSFSMLSASAIRFHFAEASTGDGPYVLTLANGGIVDIRGNGNEAWSAGFAVDSQGPTVTVTSVDEGALLAPGVQTITVTFDEPIAESELSLADMQLRETLSGQVRAITAFSYDPFSFTLTLTSASLGEGSYELTLLSGLYGFRDIHGNSLDGDANGSGGDNFTLGFGVDIESMAYPPMVGLPPLGSLVYDPLVEGLIHATGDVDTYTVHLDGGQFLTAVAHVLSDELQLEIAVRDADDDTVVATLSGAAGQSLALQALRGLAGEYRVEVRGLAGTGLYRFALILNALAEPEMLGGGASNNTVGTATALDDASLNVGANGGNRLAVVGERSTDGTTDDDFYRVHLLEGQAASMALAWVDGGTADLHLELLAADGSPLALAMLNTAGSVQGIRDFVAPTEGDYLLRVSGAAAGQYNLVITRGLSFQLPTETVTSIRQDITLTGEVLGHLGTGSGAGSGTGAGTAISMGTTLNDASEFRWDIQRDGSIGDGTNDAYDGGMDNTAMVNFSTGLAEDNGREILIGPHATGGVQLSRKIYVPVDQSFARFLEIVTNTSASTVNFTVPIYTNLGSDGSERFNMTSSGDSTVTTADNWLITDDSTAGTSGGDPVVTHVVAGDGARVRPSSFSGGSGAGAVSYSYNLTLAPGETQIIMHFASQAANQATALTRAPELAATRLGTLDGLSALEKTAIQNFRVDPGTFTVQVTAGDVLQISTSTPGDGPGEPGNTLNPEIELLNPSGTVVSFDRDGAADGRNAVLTHTALATGTYSVRVMATAGSGAFLLRVAGATGTPAPLTVIGASVNEGQVLTVAPSTIDIDFSGTLRLQSIQAADLQVNGQAATGVLQIDGNTLRFDVTGLLGSDGLYTLEIAAASLSDTSGAGNTAFTRSFVLDNTLPTVTASSVAEGSVIAPGAHTLVFTLSEDLASSGLGAADIQLVNSTTGQSYGTASFVYDAATDQITVQYASLPEGAYTLTLFSGASALRDLVGNALNGNASTPEPDNYRLGFVVDTTTAPMPELALLAPAGSLIYRAEVAGRALHASSDIDAFTLSLDPGQTLSLWASPNPGTARLVIELFDATEGGNSLGRAEAASTTQTVLLQTLAVTGGNYRIEVRSAEGSGTYTLRALLNAALESESVGGSSNNTLAAAQDLTGSLISTGSDRAAVVGQFNESAPAADWYSLHLDAGQLASVALTPDGGLVNLEMQLGLYDGAGNLLTAGTDIAGNIDESITDFAAPAAGTYYLRVAGTGGGQYSLVVTRGQSISLELNNAAQDISPTGNVLGALGGRGDGQSIRVAVVNSGSAGNVTSQLNNDTFFNFTASSVSLGQIDTLAELAAFDVVMLGDSGTSHTQLQSIAPLLRQWTESGGGVVGTGWLIYSVGASTGTSIADLDAIFPVNTTPGYSYLSGVQLTITDNTHPVTSGVTSFLVNDYVEYSSLGVDAGAGVLATASGQASVVVGTAGSGRSVYLGPTYMGGGGNLFSGMADRLLEQAVAWAAGDSVDEYLLQVNAGDVLQLSSTTPFDGAAQPASLLDLRIELLDATGTMVASDDDSAADGRNARLDHTALTGGSYKVRVLQEPGSARGDYVLRATGATGATQTGPQVLATDPTDGKRLGTPPGSLTFTLNEGVLASSVGIDDLSLSGGGTVTGIEIIDGDTVRFLISTPDVEGDYAYTLLAGGITDLQGAGNLAYSGGFTVDKTVPRVVSQNPEVQSVSPFGSWSVTFSEPLDRTSVQTGDFQLRNPNNSGIGISSATVSEDGMTVTLNFSGQFTEGDYTLTVGNNILDLAGNRMDQDSSTAGEQTYIGTVQVASPDLSPVEISVTLPGGGAIPEGGVALGSQVRVTWTVRNIGTDAARSSGWFDSLWISTDTNPANDVFLGAHYIDTDPTNTIGLPPGEQYTMTALVTVPLNDSFNPVNHFIRVQVDNYDNYYYYNYQPENNENNNGLYSAAFATVVPPLPDLTVSNVTVPEFLEAGKAMTVTWTVNNTGGATAPAWYDRIVLSADTVYGNADDVYLNGASDVYSGATLAGGASLARSATVTVPAENTGTWNVLVHADIYNNVYERAQENNNVGVSSNPVQVVVATEDLTPTSITAPDSAVLGGTITVAWSVQNAGSGPTYSDWHDSIVLSTDQILGNSDDRYLADLRASSEPSVRPLAAGASYSRSLEDIRLPLDAGLNAGNYYLLVKSDYYGSEPELNENNNLLARPITLSLPQIADLSVSSVTVPQEPMFSGETATVHFTLHNSGSAAASNFHNHLYLSSNGSGQTIYVGDYYYTQTLAAGASVTVEQTITVPLYNPGNWFLLVVADANGEVYEHTNENNNRASSPTTLNASLPPLPDLLVSNIVAPLDALAGGEITITWTVTNQGTATSGPWTDSLHLSTDGGISNSIPLGSFAFEGTLAAGASVTRTQVFRLGDRFDGLRTVVVTTDAGNQVNETHQDSGNNRAVDNTSIRVTFPPLPNLQVTALTPPTDPASGTSTVVSWVVTNNGTGATSAAYWYDHVRLSLNTLWGDGDDIDMGIVLNPNYLSVGESYTNSRTISIPKGLNGDYYFLVKTDTYDNVEEDTNEGDNILVSPLTRIALTPPPDLRVQRVEADNVAFSGENITVSWTIVNDDRFASGRTLEAGWADRVIMSSDDVLGNADDRNLGDFWHVGTGNGALAPGESYQVTRSLRLPIGVVGEHYFFVIADVNNHVYEHGFEFNNSGVDMLPDDSAPEATSILLTPPPDLEVMRVTTPGSALAGNPFTVSWQVGNFGSEATRNNYWVDRVYLSIDGALDGSDILLGERGHSGALERYEEDDNGDPVGNYFYTNSATFTLPFGISGNYRVIVKTDATSQVFEGLPNPTDPFGENNNTGTSGNLVVASQPADLVVSSFAAPSAGEAGRQVSLSWTVTNQGIGSSVTNLILDRVYVSYDEIFGDADDILLDTAARNGVVQAEGSYVHNEAVTLPLNLVDGTYWLYVRADAPNSVYESDESNNLADRRITVTRNIADLQVTRIGHDATGTAGQGLAVDWRVDNEGSSQTNIGYWYDAAYLSLDQTLDGNDVLLGARYRNSGLGVDQGYDAVANFTVPSNLATNDYFIILRTDRDNQVAEGMAGELNNILASSGTVHITAAVTAPPDLVVLSVDAPDAAISGQSMTLSWTVRNDGIGAADNRSWYDAVYLSRDGVLDRNADIYLGYASRSGLDVGESYTQTLDVAIPYGQSGPFYAFVVTDAGRHIPESDEFNNATQDAAFTQVSLAPPADLVVGTITLPENGVPGRTATIGFSINNNGTNPAMGSWSDSVYLSLDETWDIDDALFGVATYSGTVAGSSSYSNTVTGILPGVTPGDYHVIVRSDIRNHIPESNEANNIGGSLDTVALDVDSLTMGVAQTYTLGTGQAVYYKFEVAAGETVRITLDSSADDIANELFVRHGSMPTRGQFDVAAREGFTADPQLVIPTTEAGTYYVLAYGQYAPGSPQFSIRAEIIPFSITDVDARIVSNAGNATLRIQGAKFGANTDFSLLGPDGNRVYAHDIQLDSSSEAYASFNLFQIPLGSYTVVAEQLGTQPDGSTGVLSSTTLANAVIVREAADGDGMYMNIAGPTDVMVNRTNLFTMNYVNDGGADVMAPLIIFESFTATPIGLSATSMHTSPVQILAASYDGPMDILRPGARYSVPMVFQSPGDTMALDMRAGRIMSDDIRLIEDWDTIESSIRPLNLDSEDWEAFWGRVQPLIGSTWGDYVTVLNSMMLLVSDPGQPIRGVRDIFTRLYALNPDYVPYAAMRGEVHDAESDIGLPDVQMAAYLVHEDGRLEHKATTITNEDGLYSFARLMPGTYKIVPVGRALDMDRNGQLDLTAPQFTLSHTAPGNAGIIYVQPLAGIGASNDSNPVLDRDASGTTHMVWTRDGIVWHAWYDLATARWKDAQAISTGESYAPAIASSEQLFHDATNQTSAGTVITWQQGRGNASEIWYAVARAKAGGGFEWSAPEQLTSDDTLDVAPEVIIGDTGLVMITHLKRDGDIQDDTDIYYDIFAMSESDFTWPAAVEPEVAAVDLAPADAVLDPEGVSLAYGRQWKFGPWDFFGTEAEIVLALSGQISEADCKATLGAQGQVSGSFKGSSIRSTISGNGNVAAEWSVNEAAKDWQFNSAKAGWGASAQFDWRYGLSTLLSKIPHPAVTSAYLAYSLAVGLAGKFGLTFEDGITFGGGASFSGMEWKLTQPFPDFVWPESIDEASLSGTLGVYAQLDAGPDSARLQGDITVTVDIAPEVQLKSITGNITFSGNIGWFTFNEVFSISFYSASGMETADGALQTQDASEPIFDPGSLLGSTALYGTNHLVANAGSDLAIDSAVSMARDGSVLFGAWTHMADPNVEIGSDVMVSEYAGSWTTPVAIAGALGLNSDATAAVDAQGRRMVLWTHAASGGLNGGNLTLDAYEAALDSNNVVFATYDELTGSWSAMQTLAVTEGMDTGLSIGKDASGNIVASWVRKGADTLDHLMTATWNGSSWSAATEIAAGASIMDPAIEQLGNGVIVMWEQDGDPDPDASEFTLHYSIFTGTAWSAGAIFDPIAMATGLALSAGMPVASVAADTSLDTQALFPPFPVPEECLKCKPEEIKRIRESAPVCRDGGGTVVTFDSKTCTEKTIVYRPCVVRPRDPNDIIGPEGFGDAGWIAASSTMGYMIRFENAADASAPAQEVVITQQLDSDLDWRTFRIDDFGFGDQIIEVDGKSAFYQKRLDFTGDPTRGYFLDVSASVDISTGIVTWKLTTIDPNTGDVPQEASIGFLPVNDTVYDENQEVVTQGTGRGEGYVTYTVKALRNAGTGTVIDAQALIVFDTEEPIETPAISHTLDALDPESAVVAFETATTANPEIGVRWGGQDDAEGSGVRDYVVWVSVNGADFEVWLVDTELTEAIYIGEDGNTYSFFTTARDNAGNEEAEPVVGDATITVSGGTGSITGTKFEDHDGDGVRDAGETGLAGWTIYLDADNNSVFGAGEISTVTGADGGYSFLDLNPGAYTVREVALTGWVQTAPGASGHAATVVSGETSDGIDFGNFALAQIGGQLFSDGNANGALDDGEEGLAGWTLTLDKDGNGSTDATTTTDAYGFYRFTGVGPGSYTVMQVPQAGWLPTGPASGRHTVTTTSGADIGGADFANVAAASISGTKFEDMNGDGQRDADERGLPGWTIFLDANANGSLDGSERFVITGATGAYSFTDLLPGSYVIAEVMQDGWVQTSPGAGPSSAAAGVTLSLSGMDVVLSLPEDVVVEGDIGIQAASANELADTLVGLDAFRADPRFAGITGTRVTTVVIDTGIDLNHSWFGPDADNNGVADRIVYSYDFADQDANAGDLNGHGSHIASLIGGQDATYGGVAPGADLIALKVFRDDGSGYFSYLEAALQWVVLNASAYDVGVINLSLGDGGNWDSAIGRYGLGDELAALAGMNILITAASGNNYFQYSGELGVAYPAADPAVLGVGAVWSGSFGGPVNYANGAADYSTGADRLAAFGQRDGALLDVLAPGTRMVGANYNGGTRTMFGTSQASAYLAGVATLAQDLALDHLGRKLSMAEFSSLLASTSVVVRDGDDEHDNVENTGLDFARIDLLSLAEGIRAMTADGPGDTTDGGDTSTGGETQPLAAPGVHQFSLTAGEQHTGTDFGNFLLGSIGGTVFDDRNANAAQDGADAGLGGWTVFLDGNSNGQRDIGEHGTVTLADGSYRFNGIGPGSYHVSLIGQDGWTRTTAAAVDVAMTSGLQADADFGVNALPALAAIGDKLVDEGSMLTFNASGTDDTADSLVYSLAGDSHGATIDAATGAFQWNAPDGNASTGFTVRVTDGAGGVAERSFAVTVANVAPSLTLGGAASVTDDQDFVLDLASSDPGQDTLSGWTVQWGDGSSSLLETAAGNLSHRYAAPGDYTVLATATDEDGSYSTSTTVTVLPGTLKVSALTATATGFQVRFNRGFVPGEINLFDSSFYNRGAADIALRDAAGRNVAGSVVLDDDHQGLTFVRTGGLLANGSYTVTLDSRSNAFATAQGGLLDGNRDGTAGDHFSGSFSIAGSGAVLRIGEFARGPGQAVDVPATAAGVPITISGATGAQQVDFTLAYDPALLAITGVSGGAGIPSGSTVSADFSTPGEVRITLSLGSALGAGSLELVRLSANVPGSAPYGAKQVLDLRDISLDTGAAVRDDDGLHLAAYLGDTSGNAKYSTLDVQRIQRAVLRMDSGFGAYPLIDPVVVADINGNGALSSLDAQRVLSEVMGLDRAEIPAIPQGMTLTFSGPDPVVSAASVAGAPGETVVVPITLDTAAGLESVEITLLYPADSLQLLDVRLGGLTQDFQYFVKDTSVPGRIAIDMARMSTMAGGAGTLVELEFRVADDAQGSLAIDLQATALNETRLTLNAESQPGLDPTDGRIILPVAQAPVVVVTTVQAPAPEAAPATVLPSFEMASPAVQPLPQINFSQPVSLDAGARPSTGWVNDWVAGSRDTSTNPLKLNNWKLSAPITRITSR